MTHKAVQHLQVPGHPHCACCSFLPPYIVRKLSESDDPVIRKVAFDTVQADAIARTRRETLPSGMMGASMMPGSGRRRTICDMDGRENPLPGEVKRKEAAPHSGDEDVDRAYEHAGTTYDFYKKVLNRESLDDAGHALVASVHFGYQIANAFWDGQRMIYGDGDGDYFLSFTRSLAIAAHEMSHGVINFTSNLVYQDQSGALNESFCDVMGAGVEQWHAKQSVADANWLIGTGIFGPQLQGIGGIRSFGEAPAFADHPVLGSDIQPKHMRDYNADVNDHGGVHINSGIPNHAFYLASQTLGGNIWENTIPIWYSAFTAGLSRQADFSQAASATVHSARRLFGDTEAAAVASAWEAVGVKSEE